MKVAVINNLFYPDEYGGTETYLRCILPELSKRTDTVVITGRRSASGSPTTCSDDNQSSLHIRELTDTNLYPLWNWRGHPMVERLLWHAVDLWGGLGEASLLDCLQEEQPDVVHTHNIRGLSLSMFDGIKSSGISHVHTLHDFFLISPLSNLLLGDIPIPPSAIFNKLYQTRTRSLTDSIRTVIGPSQFILDGHVAQHFFGTARKYVLRLPSAPATSLDRRLVLGPERLGGGELMFLFAGSLERSKGVLVFLDAIKQVRNRKAAFHIVGRGTLEKTVLSAARNDPRIRFHGYVSREGLHDLYTNSDVFVFPSVWPENAPMVISEAFAAGVPIAAANVGGVKELVSDGNGWLIRPGSSRDLARTLEEIIEDPQSIPIKRRALLETNPLPTVQDHVSRLL